MKHCPEATQDRAVNDANKARTVKQFGYGPKNLDSYNSAFWSKKAKRWELPVLLSKLRLCGNCAAFDISDKMVECGGASYDGAVGYCRGHNFSCSYMRTCDTWSPGGPAVE